MQDALKAIRTYKEEKEAWKGAYFALDEKMQTSNEEIKEELDKLKDQINQEQKARKRAETSNFIKVLIALGAGVAIGNL